MKRIQSLLLSTVIALGLSSAADGQETSDDCARIKVEKMERPNVVWQPGPDGRQIPLWPKNVKIKAPETNGYPEMVGNGSPLIAGRTWNWATYVSHPTMTVYPPKGENNGAAMLVLPGGGYVAVAMDLEGTEICDWITEHGVTCVVLKYRAPQFWKRGEDGVRTPPDGDMLPIKDAQRAMGLLRSKASSYAIDPEKIGVIGFSAGAHLAAAVSNADKRTYDPVDAADKVSARPDFAIVMYPGKFLSERNPVGKPELGPWMEISAKAPPTLLVHAMNDATNNVQNSIAYGLALDEVGVPVDMRFFAKGCHAFGLRPTSDPVTTQWPKHAIEWLQSIDML
ncbi:MAG: alpha/beta hydrolase [Pacificimonas sp.]